MAETERRSWFWGSVAMALAVRLVLIWFVDALNLGSRPEVATPLTSLRRLAEGQWLKQSSMSPYAGSMYHGSPLLLSILGPLAVKRIEGLPSHLICSLVFVSTDFIAAMLIRATGWNLHFSYNQFLGPLNLSQLQKASGCGDFAALIYLWNPLTVVACVGSSTAPIENLMVILSLYGACTRRVPLAAFGWVVATHLSLYPAILILPVILLLGYGPDAPPKKLFKSVEQQRNPNTSGSSRRSEQPGPLVHSFSSKAVVHFILWSAIWSIYVLGLCSISLKQYGGLREMFKKTHGFILTVEDLSPNLGVLWYFFAEVFDFFRTFFLLVFHANILFMILPLAIRLKHRPCFLAFVYIAIASMLKSYPSVGDSALYLGLMSLFINELAGMRFSFFLLSGYIGVFLLSPVMHNLWIWRGTGNANFYFATALAYACLQIVLVVESVESMLNHDRMLRKQLKLTATKSE